MASTFNLLTAGGAKFNKKRFAHDFELFEKGKVKKTKKGKEKAVPASDGIPSALDFFHSAHLSEQPGHATQDEVDDESDAESSSSSSSSTHPEPPKQKITLTGNAPLPKSIQSSLLSLVTHPDASLDSMAGEPFLSALRAANIHSLWGVQCAVAGSLLSRRDTMCIAATGSGKTLAYLLPTLVLLRDPTRELREREQRASEVGKKRGGGKKQKQRAKDSAETAEGETEGEGNGRGIRAIVVVPTHDLAVQIHAVLKAITKGRAWRTMLLSKATEKAVIESSPGETTGGNAKGPVEAEGDSEEEETPTPGGGRDGALPLGIDILIATPERLHHLIDSKSLDLSQTRHLVLDEADRLFSDDFRPQIEPILAAANHPRCLKAFLSATIPSGSEALAKRWLRDGGVRVVVGLKDSAVSTVDQSLLYTASEPGKILALRQLLSTGQLPYPSLIFVQSVARAEELHRALVLDNVDSSTLRLGVVHGDKSVKARDDAVRGFREGSIWVLVVTEVMARGMDFRGVKVVINYDFPQTTQSYIHRIGRSGRGGQPGKAITFFTDLDAPHLRAIANVMRASGCQVPEWMLELKKADKNERKKRAKVPVKRGRVGEGGRDVGKERAKKKREMIEASKRRQMKAAKGREGAEQ